MTDRDQLLLRLDATVRQVCPLTGWTRFAPGDPSGCEPTVSPDATPAERAAAAAAVAAFDWSEAAQAAWEAEQARAAAESLGESTDPVPLGTRAGFLVARQGTMDDRICLAAVVASLDEVRAALSLPPSGIEVPPLLSVEECEGLRREAVAGLLGLPPMARAGE